MNASRLSRRAVLAGAAVGVAPVADPADPTLFHAYDTDTGTRLAGTGSGRSFTARATGLPAGDSRFEPVAAPDRSGGLWLGAKGNGLHRSTDGGFALTGVDRCRASYTLGFGKAADGADHRAIHQAGSTEAVTAVHRSDDQARTRTRIDDDAHQCGRTGDPRAHGRVHLATDGIQYGEPV